MVLCRCSGRRIKARALNRQCPGHSPEKMNSGQPSILNALGPKPGPAASPSHMQMAGISAPRQSILLLHCSSTWRSQRCAGSLSRGSCQACWYAKGSSAGGGTNWRKLLWRSLERLPGWPRSGSNPCPGARHSSASEPAPHAGAGPKPDQQNRPARRQRTSLPGREQCPPLWGALVPFLVSLMVVLPALWALRAPTPAITTALQGPWWLWRCGAIGAVYVASADTPAWRGRLSGLRGGGRAGRPWDSRPSPWPGSAGSTCS